MPVSNPLNVSTKVTPGQMLDTFGRKTDSLFRLKLSHIRAQVTLFSLKGSNSRSTFLVNQLIENQPKLLSRKRKRAAVSPQHHALLEEKKVRQVTINLAITPWVTAIFRRIQ